MCLCQCATLSGMRSFSSSSVAFGRAVNITPSSLNLCVGVSMYSSEDGYVGSNWLSASRPYASLLKWYCGCFTFGLAWIYPVGDRLPVVLVLLHRGLHRLDHRFGLLLVARPLGPQRRDVHVALHGGHARPQCAHIHAVHIGYAAHIHPAHVMLLFGCRSRPQRSCR